MIRSRRQIVSLAAIVFTASLVAACGSSPTTSFYTLATVPADTTMPARQPPAVIAVGPVRLPDYIDRPQFVTRSSSYSISLAAFDQWAGPLDDMLPRALADDLTQRLPGDRVVSFPQVSGPNFDYRIAVNINQFDVDSTGTATLAAQWQIYDVNSPRALIVEEDTFRRQATGSSYEAYTAALSFVLADLSDRLRDNLGAVRGAAPRPITVQ